MSNDRKRDDDDADDTFWMSVYFGWLINAIMSAFE